MRQLILTIARLCVLPLFLFACGNSNTGKPLTPYNYSSKSSPVVATAHAAAAQPLYCSGPLLTGADPALAAAFSGSSLCATQATNAAMSTKGASVILHATAAAGSAVCIVPFLGDNPTTESCFTLLPGGQTAVQLTTDSYTSLVLLPQSDLAAYRNYLQNPGSVAPPRLLYSMI